MSAPVRGGQVISYAYVSVPIAGLVSVTTKDVPAVTALTYTEFATPAALVGHTRILEITCAFALATVTVAADAVVVIVPAIASVLLVFTLLYVIPEGEPASRS